MKDYIIMYEGIVGRETISCHSMLEAAKIATIRAIKYKTRILMIAVDVINFDGDADTVD